jgi:voltage-gated potassium channel Kch
MLVTPVLAHFSQRLARDRGPSTPQERPPEDQQVPVVLAGYGRVGRRIGDLLTRAGLPFVALESDASIVARERARGHPVYYGDASSTGVLRSVGAGSARIIVVTLNNPETAKHLVTALRDQFPAASIFARGHNLETCQRLHELGASGVVSENFEASLEISRMVLEASGADDGESERILADFRDRYHALIHDLETASEGAGETGAAQGGGKPERPPA